MSSFTIDMINNHTLDKNLKRSFIELCDNCERHIPVSFFEDTWKIISNFTGEYTTAYLNRDLTDFEKEKILSLLKVALELYKESISEKQYIKTLQSLCIFEFFSQSFLLLPREWITEEYNKSIKQYLFGIQMRIQGISNAPYSTKKTINDLTSAEKNNDYRLMLTTYGMRFDSIDEQVETWGLFIKWIWSLNKSWIFEYLYQCNSVSAELVLKSLSNELLVLLSEYDYSKNLYPLLRGFMLLLNKTEKEAYTDLSVNKNVVSKYFDLFYDLITQNSIDWSLYIPVMNISHKKIFNYLFGYVVGKNIRFLELYLKFANMTFEASQAFTEGFLGDVKNDADLLKVSKEIFSIYIEKEVTSPTKVNQISGYLDIFIISNSILFSSRESFLEELTRVTEKISLQQNSWNHKGLTKLWVELYYVILSNKKLNFNFNEDEVRKFIPIIYDKRYELIYTEKHFYFMKQLLYDPSSVKKLEFEAYGKEYIRTFIEKV